jgi:hypothetical protein
MGGVMVAASIALVFEAIYWGFLLSVAAVVVGCFLRSVLEEGHPIGGHGNIGSEAKSLRLTVRKSAVR